MKRARSVLLSVASLAVPYFSTLYYTRYDSRKKYTEHETRVLILSATSVRKKNIILRRTERDMIINVHIHVKFPLCVSDCKETLISSTDFRKILKY